jgi:hypothetical protein
MLLIYGKVLMASGEEVNRKVVFKGCFGPQRGTENPDSYRERAAEIVIGEAKKLLEFPPDGYRDYVVIPYYILQSIISLTHSSLCGAVIRI